MTGEVLAIPGSSAADKAAHARALADMAWADARKKVRPWHNLPRVLLRATMHTEGGPCLGQYVFQCVIPLNTWHIDAPSITSLAPELGGYPRESQEELAHVLTSGAFTLCINFGMAWTSLHLAHIV